LAGPAGYRLTKVWTIAVFPARAGIDTSGLALDGDLRSKAGRIGKEDFGEEKSKATRVAAPRW